MSEHWRKHTLSYQNIQTGEVRFAKLDFKLAFAPMHFGCWHSSNRLFESGDKIFNFAVIDVFIGYYLMLNFPKKLCPSAQNSTRRSLLFFSSFFK